MIDHLSYSSISTYLMCPRSWRFRYIDKAEAPTSTALVFGSAFHNAIEGYIRAKHANGNAELLSIWGAEWNKQVEKALNIEWGGDTPEQIFNDGVRILSDDAVASVIDGIVPLGHNDNAELMIEEFVELRVPSVPVPVIGYIDVITSDGVPCDLKTSSKAWSLGRAQSEMQPSFYLAALNQMGYDLNPERRFRHYVFTKTKTPRVDILETERSVAELLWLFDLIRDVWRGIEAGVFPPNPGTWKCSQKWCEYWPACRGAL